MTEIAANQDRWAVIKTIHGGDDLIGPRELVISTQTRDRHEGPPSFHHLRNSEHREDYCAERVPDSVQAGMVRGGPVDNVGGFGWRSADERTANGYSVASKAPVLGVPQRRVRDRPSAPNPESPDPLAAA